MRRFFQKVTSKSGLRDKVRAARLPGEITRNKRGKIKKMAKAVDVSYAKGYAGSGTFTITGAKR